MGWALEGKEGTNLVSLTASQVLPLAKGMYQVYLLAKGMNQVYLLAKGTNQVYLLAKGLYQVYLLAKGLYQVYLLEKGLYQVFLWRLLNASQVGVLLLAIIRGLFFPLLEVEVRVHTRIMIWKVTAKRYLVRKRR